MPAFKNHVGNWVGGKHQLSQMMMFLLTKLVPECDPNSYTVTVKPTSNFLVKPPFGEKPCPCITNKADLPGKIYRSTFTALFFFFKKKVKNYK